MKRWQEIMPEQDRAIYEKAGFAGRRPFGHNPALLVVDVTVSFIGTKPKDVLKSIDEFKTSCGEAGWAALAPIKKLLDTCREKGVRVVYTAGDPTAAWHMPGVTKTAKAPADLEAAWEREKIAELIAPLPSEWVLRKSRASTFFGTPLATYLHRHDVDTLLVVGTTTSGCVRASVTDAHSHGFRVFVVEECVFDRSEMSHLVNLYEMNAKYADVITLAEALEYVGQLRE